MKFTVHEIYKKEDKRPLTLEDIEKIFSQDKEEYVLNNTLYVLQVEKTPNYCFIEIKLGQTEAIDCYDKHQQSFTNQILGENLVHTNEQFFILIKYEADHTWLYLSNWEKRGVFLSFCQTKDIDVKIMDMASNIDEFTNKVKELSTISLRVTDALYIHDFLNPTWYEDWDMKRPRSFSMKISYGCKIDNNILKRQYKKLEGNVFIENLQLEGKDEDDKVLLFNTKALVSKIEIDIVKEQGYYPPSKVKTHLLEKIK